MFFLRQPPILTAGFSGRSEKREKEFKGSRWFSLLGKRKLFQLARDWGVAPSAGCSHSMHGALESSTQRHPQSAGLHLCVVGGLWVCGCEVEAWGSQEVRAIFHYWGIQDWYRRSCLKTKPTESKHTLGVTPLLHSFPIYYDLLDHLLNVNSPTQCLPLQWGLNPTERSLQAKLILSQFWPMVSKGTHSLVSSPSHLDSLASGHPLLQVSWLQPYLNALSS